MGRTAITEDEHDRLCEIDSVFAEIRLEDTEIFRSVSRRTGRLKYLILCCDINRSVVKAVTGMLGYIDHPAHSWNEATNVEVVIQSTERWSFSWNEGTVMSSRHCRNRLAGFTDRNIGFVVNRDKTRLFDTEPP